MTLPSGIGLTGFRLQHSPENETSIFRLSGKEVHRKGGAQVTQPGRPLERALRNNMNEHASGTERGGAKPLRTLLHVNTPLLVNRKKSWETDYQYHRSQTTAGSLNRSMPEVGSH